jgi:hypothetical protein
VPHSWDELRRTKQRVGGDYAGGKAASSRRSPKEQKQKPQIFAKAAKFCATKARAKSKAGGVLFANAVITWVLVITKEGWRRKAAATMQKHQR